MSDVLWQPTPNGPPQPRGVFSCRILNCTQKLPVCRMLNHVRTFHMASLTEVSRIHENDYFIWAIYTFIDYFLESFAWYRR